MSHGCGVLSRGAAKPADIEAGCESLRQKEVGEEQDTTATGIRKVFAKLSCSSCSAEESCSVGDWVKTVSKIIAYILDDWLSIALHRSSVKLVLLPVRSVDQMHRKLALTGKVDQMTDF